MAGISSEALADLARHGNRAIFWLDFAQRIALELIVAARDGTMDAATIADELEKTFLGLELRVIAPRTAFENTLLFDRKFARQRKFHRERMAFYRARDKAGAGPGPRKTSKPGKSSAKSAQDAEELAWYQQEMERANAADDQAGGDFFGGEQGEQD